MKSKTNYVNNLLKFRSLAVNLWSILPRFVSHFFLNIFRDNNSILGFGIRYLCVNRLSKRCGDKVIVFPMVIFKNIESLELGTNISIHEMCYIDAYGGIKIGDDVSISHSVSMLSFDHDISSASIKYKDASPIKGPIEIKNNIWIGAGVKILKNVKVSSNSVVAAGAVVNREVNESSLVAGIPAKEIKKIFND